jgi:hypothetical protein
VRQAAPQPETPASPTTGRIYCSPLIRFGPDRRRTEPNGTEEADIFTVWDVAQVGYPRAGWLGTHWSDGRLISVTVRRSLADNDDEPPALAVTTMDPAVPGATHEGLVMGPLLELTGRLMSARRISAGEASQALVRLAGSTGTPAALTLGGRVVEAAGYQVPGTGDWAVAAVNDHARVCVSGIHGLAVPALEAANMVLWGPSLRRQIADLT